MNALDFVNLVTGQLGWGAETDVSSLSADGDKVLVITNAILQSMQNDKVWPELRTEGWINKTAPRTTDSYGEVTFGSTTLTLNAASTDSFTSADVGKLVQVGSYLPYYRIDTYTDANNVELEMPWKDVAATGQALVIGQDKYSLPSDMDMLLSGSMRNLSTNTVLEEIEPTQMRKVRNDDGLSIVQEEPRYFTIHGLDSAGDRVVHFDRVSDAVYTLEYDYQADHPELTASTDKVLYPDKYIMYIADSVIAKLKRDVEDSDKAVQAASDSLREATRVGSNPNNSRDRLRLSVQGTSHGAYRRRG